jgi:hypothetical protein
LTGDGEFCSKEHRKLYQKEHSQLALERLLNAQPHAPPRPPGKAAPPDPRDSVQAEVVTLGKGSAKQAPKKPDPLPAAFLAEVVQAAPVSGPVRLARPPLGETEAQWPRWKELPRPATPRITAPARPPASAFLQPGCFLRRKSQPAAPVFGPEANPGRGSALEPAPFVPAVLEMNYLEKCMLRTERLGFSPP